MSVIDRGLEIDYRNYQREIKSDKGKPRLALVPPIAIEAIGTIMTYGLEKYFEGSWKQVEAYRYRDALVRHLCEYLRDPYGVDEESGHKHLWHITTNAAFLCELEKEDKKAEQPKKVRYKYDYKDYELTNKETGKIAFKCLNCGRINIFMAKTSDGGTCEHCAGYIAPIGWAKKKEE